MAYKWMPQNYVPPQLARRGMGSACCDSCAHGGSCSGCGSGMGLFDSGVDFTQWGIAEWSIAAIGAYAVISMFQTTSRGYKVVKAYPGERRRKRAKALRERADKIEGRTSRVKK